MERIQSVTASFRDVFFCLPMFFGKPYYCGKAGAGEDRAMAEK